MQNDEMIWQVINHQFCSYKSTLTKSKGANKDKREFCKHPYSTTGVCNRSSCPLANSHYATVKEEHGRIHLYIKTVERAHSPKNLWEKIYLSRNYTKALGQLDEHLAYFPKASVHRNKQRLTKIHQYLLRMRKLKLREVNGTKAKMTRVHKKVEQREERREKKALVAAKIEATIEKELMERLAKGTYGDIYNFPEVPYQKALETLANQEKEMEMEGEGQEEMSEEELDTEEEDESEDEEEGLVEYVEDLEEEDEEDMEQDMEDMEMNAWDDNEASEDDDDDDDDDDNDDSSNSQEDDDSEDASSQEDELESGSNDDDDDNDNDDDGSSSNDSDEDDNDSTNKKKKKKPSPSRNNKKQPPPPKARPKRGVRVEIEYEDENEGYMEAEGVAASSGGAGMAW